MAKHGHTLTDNKASVTGTIEGSDRILNGITINLQQQAPQETLQKHLESAAEEWAESRLCIH